MIESINPNNPNNPVGPFDQNEEAEQTISADPFEEPTRLLKLTGEQVKVIKEWIAELRSGNYNQGIGKLKATGLVRDVKGVVCGVDGEGIKGLGHCCLGVLCELAVEKGVIGPAVEGSVGAWIFDSNKYNAPTTVRNWAGLKRPGDIGPLDFTTQDLMDMNDSKKTFEEIADFIEAHLVKYLWLEALESGEYRQAKGVLCDAMSSIAMGKEVGYCCLGVLCEVVMKNDLFPLVRMEGEQAQAYGLAGVAYVYKPEIGWSGDLKYNYAHNSCLPNRMLDRLHLRGIRGEFGLNAACGYPENLAQINDANDDFGKTIEAIKHNLPFTNLKPTARFVQMIGEGGSDDGYKLEEIK